MMPVRPRPVAVWLRRAIRLASGLLAWLVWVLGVRRKVVLANLRLAFPGKEESELRAIARATFRNLGRMAADTLLVPFMTEEELDGLFVYEGWERYEEARARGKGVIVCTGHFGSFELLAAAHSRRGFAVTMITRKMGDHRINDLWRQMRARSGIHELVVKKGETLRAARRALSEGRILGYVIDQNQPLRRAVFPRFFGLPAATSPTPAVLARRTGAAVLFAVTMPMGDGRHRVIAEGPLDLPETGEWEADVLAFMQDLNDRLERRVREHPEHWYWLHRRWKTRPQGEGTVGTQGR